MHSFAIRCLVVQSRAMQGSFILTKLRCIVLRSFASLGGVRLCVVGLCVVRYGMARVLYITKTQGHCAAMHSRRWFSSARLGAVSVISILRFVM